MVQRTYVVFRGCLLVCLKVVGLTFATGKMKCGNMWSRLGGNWETQVEVELDVFNPSYMRTHNFMFEYFEIVLCETGREMNFTYYIFTPCHLFISFVVVS